MKSTQEIYSAMKRYIADNTGIMLNDGGDMAIRLLAVAQELSTLWERSELLTRQSLPQTASGDGLDAHAALRGLSRKSATKAEGAISFYISAPASTDISIPAGTLCLSSKLWEFETVASGTIHAGEEECTVAAHAVSAGKAGNAEAGTVIYMENAPVGIEGCINRTAFRGGSDDESDSELRARIADTYRLISTGANAEFYRQQALDVPGVAAAVVIPRPRGIGTVDIVITGSSGVPTDELIDAVQERIDSCREICVDAVVAAPVTIPLGVSVTVTAKPGYDTDGLCADVENAIAGYFDGRLLGRSVHLTELADVVVSVDGAMSCTVNSPGADVSVGSSELAVLQAVAVSAV